MPDIARLVQVIEPEVAASGLDLVRVRWFKGGEIGALHEGDEYTLQVMAEDPATGQLVLNQCAALSHRISDRIDALEESGEMLIVEAYRLEVSSPGIDRPLTRTKDYAAWLGHEAKITLLQPIGGNRKTIQGDLVSFEDDVITLDERKSGRVTFPLADVQYAKLVLTDRLIAASKPLDTAGADEEIETDELQEQED
jgi:ribosome maturation factor RimP